MPITSNARRAKHFSNQIQAYYRSSKILTESTVGHSHKGYFWGSIA